MLYVWSILCSKKVKELFPRLYYRLRSGAIQFDFLGSYDHIFLNFSALYLINATNIFPDLPPDIEHLPFLFLQRHTFFSDSRIPLFLNIRALFRKDELAGQSLDNWPPDLVFVEDTFLLFNQLEGVQFIFLFLCYYSFDLWLFVFRPIVYWNVLEGVELLLVGN